MKNKNSLLAKIIGVFTVKCSRMDNVHIMLMENTLRFRDENRLKYVFDLKGSLVDRKVKGKTTNTTTLKDINFRMASKVNKDLTKFEENDRKKLLEAMRKDVEFLRRNGFMDYSLLFAIESGDSQSSFMNSAQDAATEAGVGELI